MVLCFGLDFINRNRYHNNHIIKSNCGNKSDDGYIVLVENSQYKIGKFKKPERYELETYFKFHPYQSIIIIPFNPKKAYK